MNLCKNRSRYAAVTLCVSLAASGLALTPIVATAADEAATPAAPAGAEQALAQAAATGEKVEVAQWTTETNQVFARPDGALELTAHREAVRTDINGEWEPIDTTLQRNKDGSYSPAAITTPVRFAAGGSSDLASAGDGPTALDFTIEDGTLPRATVEGNQITYPQVRPGVDIVLTATVDGYTDAVVVHDQAAAADLVRDPIVFSGTSSGLELHSTSDGALLATDPNTGDQLLSPPPIAWDSSERGIGAEADETSIGTAIVHELEPAQIDDAPAGGDDSARIEVAPPASMMSDPRTTYPLYLDPQISDSQLHFLTVHQNGWDYYDQANSLLRVGYCGWSECNPSTQGNARSYFSFDITPLALSGQDPIVYDVRLAAYQVWNASSTAQPVVLRKSGGFNSSTNWPGPAGDNLQQVSSAAGYNATNEAWIRFDNEALRQYVSNLGAVLEDRTANFSLAAPELNNKMQWKKFSNDVRMTVVFAYPPKIKAIVEQGLVKCPGKPVYSRGTASRRIDATETVPDGVSGNSGLRYQQRFFRDDANGTGPWDSTTLVRSSGWTTTNPYPQTTLAEGKYAWSGVAGALSGTDANGNPFPFAATATDPADRRFTVDSTAPSVPKITSDDFPADYWGRSISSAGQSAFRVSGLGPDVAGITYKFNSGDTAIAVPDTACDYTGPGFKKRTADQIAITPTLDDITALHAGVSNTLTVTAFDDAHNRSTATYSFYISKADDSPNPTPFRFEAESPQVEKTGSSSTMTLSPNDTAPAIGKYFAVTSTDPNGELKIKIPVNQDGYFAVGALFSGCSACGTVQAGSSAVDRGSLGEFDTTGPATSTTFAKLGGFKPSTDGATGNRYINIKLLLPKATSASAAEARIDYFTVALLQSGLYGEGKSSVEESLADAFNNFGIGSAGAIDVALEPASRDQSSPAITPQRALSRASFPAGGITVTFPAQDGIPQRTTTFKIPDATAKGDNVIAAGQRISIPQTTPQGKLAQHVDFLVASTCGAVPARPDIAFDFTHKQTDNSTRTTNTLLPNSVPRWTDLGAAPGALVSVPVGTYLEGSPARTTNGGARVFALGTDVDVLQANKPLLSVTLPTTGATFTQDCTGAPRLHVLAMAVN